MPYKGIPKRLTAKVDHCVEELKKRGGVKDPYAICIASFKRKANKDDWTQNASKK